MPWLNLEHFRNECSPFSRIQGERWHRPDTMLVDSYYGQAFDFSIFDESAVYGKTSELPVYPLDSHANYGFLRVPFRRVPKCIVRGREELETVLADARQRHRGTLVLRGQGQEYNLERSSDTLVALYGDPDASEPSLLPSAERRGISLEAVMPEWCGFLRFYLEALAQVNSSAVPTEVSDQLQRELRLLGASTDLYLLAVSVAQHYGLPSMGLDVTDDLDSALFFARNDLEQIGDQPRILRRKDHRGTAGNEPVVYVFAPFERFQLEYDSYRPSLFPRGRPDHQNAHFLHTGWGLNRNACARNLCIAMYLDPDGDFGKTRSAQEMFPGPEDDAFGGVLANIREWDVSPEFTAFLEHFYWVAAD